MRPDAPSTSYTHTHIHTYFHIVTTMVAHNRYSLSLSLIHVYKIDNDRIFFEKRHGIINNMERMDHSKNYRTLTGPFDTDV